MDRMLAMRRAALLVAIWVGIVAAVDAPPIVERTQTTPDLGTETTASVGSAVVEQFDYALADAAVPDADALWKTWVGTSAIFAGELLKIESDGKEVYACQTSSRRETLCLTDRDHDGRFEDRKSVV